MAIGGPPKSRIHYQIADGRGQPVFDSPLDDRISPEATYPRPVGTRNLSPSNHMVSAIYGVKGDGARDIRAPSLANMAQTWFNTSRIRSKSAQNWSISVKYCQCRPNVG